MKIVFLLPALLLTACSYPTVTVATAQTQATLRVIGSSATAILTIDQISAGLAKAYGEGGHALLVSHGTHHVEVRDGNVVLYRSDVYFDDASSRTITLTSAHS